MQELVYVLAQRDRFRDCQISASITAMLPGLWSLGNTLGWYKNGCTEAIIKSWHKQCFLTTVDNFFSGTHTLTASIFGRSKAKLLRSIAIDTHSRSNFFSYQLFHSDLGPRVNVWWLSYAISKNDSYPVIQGCSTSILVLVWIQIQRGETRCFVTVVLWKA